MKLALGHRLQRVQICGWFGTSAFCLGSLVTAAAGTPAATLSPNDLAMSPGPLQTAAEPSSSNELVLSGRSIALGSQTHFCDLQRSGCHTFQVSIGVYPRPSSQPAQLPRVPPVAPDTVPAGFFARENWRNASPCSSGPVLRNVVAVRFFAATSPELRQAAVDSVSGQVVGGTRSVPTLEGTYYVRVRPDESGHAVCAAVMKLMALPEVRYAREVMVDWAINRSQRNNFAAVTGAWLIGAKTRGVAIPGADHQQITNACR